jgi:hypothetical protein
MDNIDIQATLGTRHRSKTENILHHTRENKKEEQNVSRG